MKLLLIFAAILAFSLAEEEKKEIIEDSEAEASVNIELLKEGADLNTAASSYNTYVPPSQRPSQWNQPNYVQNDPSKPIQQINTGVPANVQSDYYQHQPSYPHWSTPNYHPPTTTTPVSVIKNEQFFGDNGYYKYEYQIADGTHVGEEGYYTGHTQDEENLVKKGWYSYRGADGKIYTVTYWADRTGYHAFGDHLPTPPPVPAAIQAALDKEKEAEKYKPQYDTYPTQTPAPVYYPTLPPKPPQQVTFVPPHPTYVPPQPSYTTPQPPPYQPPSYPYPQQPYYPPQQTYYPPQNYYPQKPTN